MSERYTNVFSLPANLYAPESPVVISAGTLLKDTQTGAILAQLKLRSISPKTIIGVKVRLHLFDIYQSVLGEPVEYEYLDLHVSRDAEFGQKSPIFIPEVRTRIYKVSVVSVVFEDYSIWNANGEPWKALGTPAYLPFYDSELRKQYQLNFGSNSIYKPLVDRDLWYCTCGALNHQGENCHKCHNSLAALQAMDMATLVAQKDARLAREAAEIAARIAAQQAAAAAERQRQEAAAAAERQRQEAAAAAKLQKKEAAAAAKLQKQEAAEAARQQKQEAAEAARKQKQEAAEAAKKQKQEAAEAAKRQKQESAEASKKQKQEAAEATRKQKAVKTRKFMIPAICAVVILLPLLYFFGIPAAKYCQAVSLMNAGHYEKAISAFEAMDGYSNSVQQIELCREGIKETTYRKAVTLMEQGAYPEAYGYLIELGNYKDCIKQIAACEEASEEVAYMSAVSFMENSDFEAAKEKLEKLTHYKDSKSLLQACEAELVQHKIAYADTLMNEKDYTAALVVLKELEAYGIDCGTKIAQCDTAILKDSRMTYVTSGNPSGNQASVYGVIQGDVKLHSITRVDLDNGCVRFTVDCTPPSYQDILFFNPPDGDVFKYWNQHIPAEGRQTLVFDILKEDIQAAREMTIRFFTSSDTWIYMRNAY